MKMNKMYEAPKAEMVELNVNKSFMQAGGGEMSGDGNWNGGSWDEETWS